MAIYQPTESPPTWEEFEARCRERIRKIRESKDDGHFANTYVADVEALLLVLEDAQLDYDGTAKNSYRRLRAQKLIP